MLQMRRWQGEGMELEIDEVGWFDDRRREGGWIDIVIYSSEHTVSWGEGDLSTY